MRRALAIVVLAAAAAALIAGCGGSGGTYTVRALFDDAGFAVSGEQVRIAGATVGSISSLSVTHGDLAAVTLSITNRDFTPFHANASCTIRPQSLIAERYVQCSPGTAAAPRLRLIRSGPGAGTHLLPVSRTSSPIDPDLVQNISQMPVRESLSVILDELGTGLAARGPDLNAVIRRADPALKSTTEVFRILKQQRRVLTRLAGDSNSVLAPLARVRRQLAGFVRQANTTAAATASRSRQLARSIRLLPRFLAELRPLMADLGELADQGTPLMADLNRAAPPITTEITNLRQFATVARTALVRLGSAAHRSQRNLVDSVSLAHRLNKLGRTALPPNENLQKLTASLDRSGAIGQLMAALFNGAGATNGFDAAGHYVRTAAIFGSCTAYARKPVLGCSANFPHVPAATASASGAGPAGAGAAGAPSADSAQTAAERIAAQAVAQTSRPSRAPRLARLMRFLLGGERR